MGRALRQLAEDATYHLMARGNERRQAIFLDDDDRRSFLKLLGEVSARKRWTHLAHCLMTTHFHVVATTELPNLSDGMRDLLALYARGFNRRHNQAGHLFRDRYLSVLVEDDRQLMNVLGYVGRNPVDAGIVTSPRDWEWSSYDATLRGTARAASLDTEAVLGLLHRNPIRARQLLKEIVEGEYQTFWTDEESEDLRSPTLHTLAQALTPDAAIAAATARGFHRKRIAEALGLTASTVGHRLRRFHAIQQPRPLDHPRHESTNSTPGPEVGF
jgi:REP element-mobilizing transposase RayT